MIIIAEDNITELVMKLEDMEKDVCNLPLVFAEMFKDEVNAVDEVRLYNGIKRLLKKFSEDRDKMSAVNEFVRVITGGTSLDGVIEVVIDEALNPTIISHVVVDDSCNTDDNSDHLH